MGAELPSGQVTFLFTDIEGSTRLIRRFGPDYAPLLERHRRLLRGAWEGHGGVEFGNEGDAHFVAFADAHEALAAAAELQQRIAAEDWPEGGDVRVRAGIHTGPAYPHDGDYVALAAHQAARVVGAANGGQVVVSSFALDAAGGSIAGLTVRALGAYRLRDFDGPVELFEVAAPGTPGGPARALRAVPMLGHNAEPPADAFVGRDDDLAALTELIAPGRLVTLVGPGGVGKTRLALEFTIRHAAEWADGIWVVDLAAVTTDAGVLPAVTDALGAWIGDDNPLEVVLNHVRTRRTLLVLDNCEHVLGPVRHLATQVLSGCPGVGILATSRQRLGIAGEQARPLAPLSVADAGVELFVERAHRRDPTIALDRPEDHAVVAQICRRLDGMPLAIELAAARIDVLSPTELLADLSTRMAALKARDHRTSARQRTLRALIDWSYATLDPAEQAVLRRLSPFVGSFDVTTASAAAGHGDVDPADVPEHVWSLVDKSLVTVDRREGETRYRLLETIRAVAAVYLDDAGDGPETRLRLGRRYLADLPWTTRGNRAVRARMFEAHPTLIDLAERLRVDGEAELALALLRIALESSLGSVSSTAAIAPMEAQMARFEGGAGLARLHAAVAKVLANAGQDERAQPHLDTAIELVARDGEEDLLGRVPVVGAIVELKIRTSDEADLPPLCDLVRAELARSSPPSLRADLLVELAMLQGALGDDAGAAASLTEAAVLAERLDDHILRLTVLNNLAEHDLRAGDTGRAAERQRDAMRLSRELGVPVMTAFSLVLAARMAAVVVGDEAAVRLHAAADRQLAACHFEMIPDDQALSDEMMGHARQRLGPAFDVFTEEGQAMSETEATTAAESVFAAVIAGGAKGAAACASS